MKDCLEFLIKTADENGLQHIINDKKDLEIVGKNICFHAADVEHGDKDAVKRWEDYHNNGIRCVFVYPPYLTNPYKVAVYKNILLYHCGIFKRIYARNTVCKKYPAIQMKNFFLLNNIEGYRVAKTAYVLEDKKTHEPLMSYSLGHSYFGKGNYDAEIARGACKLGVQVIGGASKLWKHILDDNPDIKSIVYYTDRREYDSRSIDHLMDGSMSSLGKVYKLKGGASFMNYWTQNVMNKDGTVWHWKGDYANREASRNSDVVAAYHSGAAIQVTNPGSFVNVFIRNGYTLNNGKVISDEVQ